MRRKDVSIFSFSCCYLFENWGFSFNSKSKGQAVSSFYPPGRDTYPENTNPFVVFPCLCKHGAPLLIPEVTLSAEDYFQLMPASFQCVRLLRRVPTVSSLSLYQPLCHLATRIVISFLSSFFLFACCFMTMFPPDLVESVLTLLLPSSCRVPSPLVRRMFCSLSPPL